MVKEIILLANLGTLLSSIVLLIFLLRSRNIEEERFIVGINGIIFAVFLLIIYTFVSTATGLREVFRLLILPPEILPILGQVVTLGILPLAAISLLVGSLLLTDNLE